MRTLYTEYDLTTLKPAPWNPRDNIQPGTPTYKELMASIKKYGITEPVVASGRTGFILSGHQRTAIALAAGVKTGPVYIIDDLTEDEEKTFCIAANRVRGEVDGAMLDQLRAEINEAVDSVSEAAPKERKEKPDTFTVFLMFRDAGQMARFAEKNGINTRAAANGGKADMTLEGVE